MVSLGPQLSNFAENGCRLTWGETNMWKRKQLKIGGGKSGQNISATFVARNCIKKPLCMENEKICTTAQDGAEVDIFHPFVALDNQLRYTMEQHFMKRFIFPA